MFWRIEVKDKPGVFNCFVERLKADLCQFSPSSHISDVQIQQVYLLTGTVAHNDLVRIAGELLCDPVIQDYEIIPADRGQLMADGYVAIQVMHKPGVMDPVEESALKGIRDLGVSSVTGLRTARRYLIESDMDRPSLLMFAEKYLYNKLIQVVVDDNQPLQDFSAAQEAAFSLKSVSLRGAEEEVLASISRQGQLSLNVSEMRKVQAYFESLRRNPTDCELETIAQTWSEHCVHKTFRGNIDYQETLAGSRSQAKRLGRRKIRNLLKSTIMKATRDLKKPYCVSVFKDNSGVIRFDEKFNVCFKVETHNHPSALEPYGGASTGIGGVIRDVLGTGLGAKPILNTDVFCFGPLETPAEKLPQGALPPRRVMRGVVSGVRDYGNRMGIPTANGAVLFDERFCANPLVYCGTVGILPRAATFKKVSAGDLIVVMGGRTGRDGIHGATFSSEELTHESESVSSGAVQIGNAITEKKVLDVLLLARDKGLFTAVTDCGAGGLSSAVGEMGAETGACVHLDRVPLKYQGLTYTEIWISEAQERMVLAVPVKKIKRFLEECRRQDVEATVIGEFTDTHKLQIHYGSHCVADLDMSFLHDGWLTAAKVARWVEPAARVPQVAQRKDWTSVLQQLLAHPNIASKEWVIRQYDHEVQAATVIKPLVGVAMDGPSDACVIKPRFDSFRGLAVSCGISAKFGDGDPYWMAASVVDEALRQLVCVGAPLDEVALLDNFCWGNPDKPDTLGGLVRAAYGAHDAAKGFGVPFISGKDSLYNEYTVGKKTMAIPGMLLISALAVIKDVRQAITMDAKEAGHLLYMVGRTEEELGGSHYFDVMKARGGRVPRVDFRRAKALMQSLSAAIGRGWVRAAHDCCEGGLAVAVAEMCLAGGLGANVFLSDVPCGDKINREDYLLFSESNSRFVVEVSRESQKNFERAMGQAAHLIGCLTPSPEVQFFGLNGKPCVQSPLGILKECWQATLREV